MNVFNSLGSNYDLRFTLKALFANNKPSHSSNLKSYLEKKYGGKTILVYKGREAIELALEILNLPKDSVVAINGFTCYAVYKAVTNEGYDAEILDLPPSADGSDLNFSAESFQKALKQNPNIKVVIIQNTLGYPCDIEKIAKVCRENNLVLIEDLAHCVGTRYLPANAKQKALQAGENGKEAGTIGDFVILSFSQDKIIDAVSGGALIIRNKKCQNHLNHLASQGETLQGWQQTIDRLYPLFTFIIRKTYQIEIGKLIHFILNFLNLLSKPMNENFYEKFSLPNWYAGLALASFNNLDKNLEHRKKIASIYNSTLDDKITSKFIRENIKLSSNLRFPIFIDNRKSLIDSLKNRGVYVSDIWYDDLDKSLPNCQITANTILNLPTHINVSEEDARRICEIINRWIIFNKLPNNLSLRAKRSNPIE